VINGPVASRFGFDQSGIQSRVTAHSANGRLTERDHGPETSSRADAAGHSNSELLTLFVVRFSLISPCTHRAHDLKQSSSRSNPS